ncbi:MAG TPA: tRNA pseudouridine(38-40) synthase TruA [Dehalococcoidia bacterium]|nr:tRNA pseudouridine(38-40) synthase TruA [Dehalococcoidia bacterium]
MTPGGEKASGRPESSSASRRIALLLEYEGTRYSGSQYQRNGRTIQEALETAISSLTGESIRVTMAGRTDSGVHAWGQVASFLTERDHDLSVFLRGINFYLPEDIAVRAVAEIPPGFNIRRRPLKRWYRYTIYLSEQRPVLARRFVWAISQPLDLEAMRQAASLLEGEHDFAAFTTPSAARAVSTVRRVYSATLTQRGRFLCFDIEASAYLMQQVRRLVGALVQLGSGKLTLEGFRQLLESGSPGMATFVAPPQGLCLMKVTYEKEFFDDEEHENI